MDNAKEFAMMEPLIRTALVRWMKNKEGIIMGSVNPSSLSDWLYTKYLIRLEELDTDQLLRLINLMKDTLWIIEKRRW